MSDCIFCKIASGAIPCKKIHEDEELLAFHDINPAAAVHFLIIPKRHIASLADAQEADAPLLAKMLLLAPKLAREQGLANGFKTAIHTGKAGGQLVFHLHMHILGGGSIKHDPAA
jgi:histidine triad (HIT) family protein